MNERMDRDRENIEVKTPKQNKFQAIQRTIIAVFFSVFSLTSYNAMTRAFGDCRLLFPKSKCINVTDDRVIY